MDIQEAALEEGALREAFNIFDQDNDGVISAAELKKMMAKLGNSLTDAEVKDIISEAGSSSTNSITLAQFNKLMTLGHKELRNRCLQSRHRGRVCPNVYGRRRRSERRGRDEICLCHL